MAELRRHDRAHDTEYVATLQAWLQAQGDPAEAGERLGVHENTVRYRLRKMAEIANLQLDDAKKRLAMMIEPRGHRHRLTMRAVETRQSTAATLSDWGKPCGGDPHHDGDNRWLSCGGGDGPQRANRRHRCRPRR